MRNKSIEPGFEDFLKKLLEEEELVFLEKVVESKGIVEEDNVYD